MYNEDLMWIREACVMQVKQLDEIKKILQDITEKEKPHRPMSPDVKRFIEDHNKWVSEKEEY